MAVSTLITTAIGEYTNIFSIPFTITFSEAVDTIVDTNLTVSGGSVLLFTKVSDSVYTGIFSPEAQGSSFTILVPAGITQSIALPEPNLISNVISSTYKSIGPTATITHDIYPIVFSKPHSFDLLFSHDIAALDALNFELVNCAISSISGSASQFTVKIVVTNSGLFSFKTKPNSILDVYGNYAVESKTIIREFESSETIIEKEEILSYDKNGKTEEYKTTLGDLTRSMDIGMIRQVGQIQSLSDCAKNIPQRLMELAQQKLTDMIMNTDEAKKIAALVEVIQQKMELVEQIRDRIDAIRKDPLSLVEEALAARGLTGAALQDKVQGLVDKFGDASGVNAVLSKIDSLGICNQSNIYPDGTYVSPLMKTPTDNIPPPIDGVNPVQFNTYTSESKDLYHDFTDRLKENYANPNPADAEVTKMIGTVTTLAMGYHDMISKTTDSSKDQEINLRYTQAVEAEKTRNNSWTDLIKKEFEIRTSNVGRTISTDVEIIRGFYNRNAPMAAGQLLSIGVTTYSGPAEDFTTFLDIKPEQRPPELTAKYRAQGKNIPSGNTYTNSAGKTFKIGTLNYSDAFNGAYGKIASERTVASTRVPGGSVIQLRNKDGSVYDPTGKNPSGMYTVMDTGNAALTYKKPDIFTSTPNLYKNTEQVHVYLISRGTKTGKQYNIAQQKFGGGQQMA